MPIADVSVTPGPRGQLPELAGVTPEGARDRKVSVGGITPNFSFAVVLTVATGAGLSVCEQRNAALVRSTLGVCV
jgi:hypothetical protein